MAIIPARGGSKGIPHKNLALVGGVPLIVRAVQSVGAAASVDRVVVTTDDPTIAAAARGAGAQTVERPFDISGDTATSESALLHALESIGERRGITVFVQATSPFIESGDIDAAVARVRSGGEDVVFSAVESHLFLWRTSPGGAIGVNHSAATRSRRQDRTAELRETGAFYVMDTAGFRSARHRFFGSIGVLIVPEVHGIEIDSPTDLAVAGALASVLDVSIDAHIDVDAVITDFDGVHTDDTALLASDGLELVRVSRSDGHGVKMLREAGIRVAIVSAETDPVVSARAAKLGIECLQPVADKEAAVRGWADAAGIPLERIAYLGNDLADLPALRVVGWPVAVADAQPAVRAEAWVVLTRGGGTGAVRELADLVLAAREAREADAAAERLERSGLEGSDPLAPEILPELSENRTL